MVTPLRVALFVGHKGPGTGAPDDPKTAYNEDEFDNAQKAACAIGAFLLLQHHQPLVITGEGADYLEERVRLALKSRADIAIACHFNAHENEQAHGCEVLFHPGCTVGSGELALACAAKIAAETGVRLRHPEDCGTVKRTGLKVLNLMLGAGVPTVIIEPLFLSNPDDQCKVAHPRYFSDFARGVASAIALWAEFWGAERIQSRESERGGEA